MFRKLPLPQRLRHSFLALAGKEKIPGESHALARAEIFRITAELMPAGKPNYTAVIRYPKISDLVQELGEPVMGTILSEIIRQFCASLNVARNMNAQQIVEAAAMLLNECDNFRLEDYVVMFQMAKRGDLGVNFYERIDIETIARIMDAFWDRRHDAGNVIRDADTLNDKQGDFRRQAPALGIKYGKDDRVMRSDSSGMIGGLAAIREMLKPQDNE